MTRLARMVVPGLPHHVTRRGNYEEDFTSLRKAEGIGRPLGTADFVTELERRLGRPIARRAPGRKAVAIPVGEQLMLQ